MRKKIIKTNNKEVYHKMSMLKFFPEVVINSGNGKDRYISKIVKSLNADGNVIDIERVGNYIVLKKRGVLNFEIYHR